MLINEKSCVIFYIFYLHQKFLTQGHSTKDDLWFQDLSCKGHIMESQGYATDSYRGAIYVKSGIACNHCNIDSYDTLKYSSKIFSHAS